MLILRIRIRIDLIHLHFQIVDIPMLIKKDFVTPNTQSHSYEIQNGGDKSCNKS